MYDGGGALAIAENGGADSTAIVVDSGAAGAVDLTATATVGRSVALSGRFRQQQCHINRKIDMPPSNATTMKNGLTGDTGSSIGTDGVGVGGGL